MTFSANKHIFNIMFDKQDRSDQFFLETQMGIVTQTGEWFHTTSEQIDSFAPGLLQKILLGDLIKEAHAWVKSADSLSLIILYVLLFLINPWIAAGVILIFHWAWHHYKSGFVVGGAGSVLQVLNSDAFLFIIAFISLSVLGFQQEYAATGLGILFFFMMKPGFLRKGWKKLNKPKTDQLTPNDQVLKMVIIKRSIWANTAPADVQQMEDRLKELAVNRKKGNN